MRNYWLTMSVALAGICLTFSICSTGGIHEAQAQSKGAGKKSATPVKTLDARADQFEKAFLREASDLAREYEKAGELEKAKEMLKAIQRLNGKTAGVGEKLKELDEQILSKNQADFDLDVSGGWGEPRGRIFKDRPFRIQATGNYRFSVTGSLGPSGFPGSDPIKEMSSNVPCGALMGLIVTKGKPTKPFTVGEELEVNPKEDGILFLRINAPPGHKCTGRLTIRLGGYILRPQ